MSNVGPQARSVKDSLGRAIMRSFFITVDVDPPLEEGELVSGEPGQGWLLNEDGVMVWTDLLTAVEASATPAAGAIPIAAADGTLDAWISPLSFQAAAYDVELDADEET